MNATNWIEGAQGLLGFVGKGLGCELGVLWDVDESSEVLRPIAVWHLSDAPLVGFESTILSARFRQGEGLPGKVWKTRQPLWIEDAENDPSFPRAASDVAGLRSALLFPLQMGRSLEGVAELLSRTTPALDPDLLETLAILGRQIAAHLSRGKAERALLDAERRVRGELEDRIIERTARIVERADELERQLEEQRKTEERLRERELAKLNESLELRITERTRSLQMSEARLAESERQLRALASRIETVQEQERAELAREIHDVLGQELTGLKMDVAWVQRRLAQPNPEGQHQASQRLDELLLQVDSLIFKVQRIATSLRPSVLDLGLAAALEWQTREFKSRSGIDVELDVPRGELPVDDARSTVVFRCFQELLTNVARHAEATAIHARLAVEKDMLVLEVRDNGRGIPRAEVVSPTSLGLLGIRERVRAFGGELAISGAPRQGTRARVWIGLDARAAPSPS